MELLTIKMLNTAVERVMNREMAALGLTYTQTTVIGYLLERREAVCQRDIEYNLGLTHPTVSSILRRMEEGGLISAEAMPSDRRYKQVALTAKSLSLSGEISGRYQKAKEKLFAGLSPGERELLARTMKRVLQNAQGL